jgi:hypothetical protein
MVDAYINYTTLDVTVAAPATLNVAINAYPHTHTESNITDLDKYTQAEVTTLLAGKADTSHTHTESDITDLDKYTQAQVDALIAGVGGGGGADITVDTSERKVELTTSPTVIFTDTIAANTLAANKIYHLTLQGWVRNFSGATVNAYVAFHYGGTKVWEEQTNSMGSDTDEIGWYADIEFTRDTDDNSQVLGGFFYVGREYSPITGFAGEIGSDEVKGHGAPLAFSSEDSTVDKVFKFEIDPSYSHDSYEWVLRRSIIRIEG